MKGRHLILAVATAVILGAVLYSGRSGSVSSADSSATSSFATPASVEAAAPASAKAEANREAKSVNEVAAAAAAIPVAQGGGVADVDPHKAFGSKNAPITVEVFSDFQCPACKQLFTTTNRQLMDNYVNTSKVYLVHRDFPLPMHAFSRVAARYVRAAAQLGRTEQAEQALFQNQEKWTQTGDVDGTLAAVLSPADMTKIRAQAKGTALDPAIEKDVALGKGYNVNQTPTTIIHFKGQTYPVVGIVSYDVLHQFLDQLLSQR